MTVPTTTDVWHVGQFVAVFWQVKQYTLHKTQTDEDCGPYPGKQFVSHVVPLNTYVELQDEHYALVGPVHASQYEWHFLMISKISSIP